MKCHFCQENEALLFTPADPQTGQPSQGICLSCAYKRNIPGVRALIKQLNLDEDHLEAETQRLNTWLRNPQWQAIMGHLIQNTEAMNPTELTKAFENPAFLNWANQLVSGLYNQAEAGVNADEPGEAAPSEMDGVIESEGSEPPLDQPDTPASSSDPEAMNPSTDSRDPSPDEPAQPSEESPKTIREFLEELFSGGVGQPIAQIIFDPNAHGGEPLTGFEDNRSEGAEEDPVSRRSNGTVEGARRNRRKILERYGTNLTELARAGKLDRLIGRDQELTRMIQILNRRTKNNPVLLGEPGVGKTALAEGLAVRIAAGEVPAKLQDFEVYLLDLTSMVAGTQFRGQFEQRMQQAIREAQKTGPIILVIDELHNIVRAGDADGAMNAANILKPALAKGSLRVIGSTTLTEYRKHIEKDSALERRFQPVRIEEPNASETFEILQGLKPYYETHHHVTYTDETLRTAIALADRYLHERFFPDKAIDLIDEAGSQANLAQQGLVRLKQITDRLTHLQREREALEEELSRCETEEARLSLYEAKAKRTAEQAQLEAEQRELEETLKPVEIQIEDLARVIETWTGIPVSAISAAETDKLLQLETRLHRRVIGQDEAVEAVSRAIRRQRAGFSKRKKPASFLFVGPTGVGKTELVKALAEALFDDERALIRMDMSEFMERHTVSKLIGSPPGYVGHEDGGQLTEKVRRHPYSVILFDEIEKAHPEVYNVLLQLLDEGRLTDSQGRCVSFENTVIVMTSNIGTSTRSTTMGFGQAIEQARKSQVHKALQEAFRPEFLNRIDEIIVFEALTRAQLKEITTLMLNEVKAAVKAHGCDLTWDSDVVNWLAQNGYSAQYGARPMRRLIRKTLEDPLAEAYLRKQLAGCRQVEVHLVQPAPEKDAAQPFRLEFLP